MGNFPPRLAARGRDDRQTVRGHRCSIGDKKRYQRGDLYGQIVRDQEPIDVNSDTVKLRVHRVSDSMWV